MSSAPTVAVLVSAGRHPASAIARACRGDAVAMAFAQKLGAASPHVVHAGDPSNTALADYLALGAGRIEVLRVDDSDDPIAALAERVRKADLIVTGLKSEASEGSGLLPYKIAHLLQRPVVTNVVAATIDTATLAVEQYLPKGQRRRIVMPLRSVIAVHPRAEVELKYAHARRVSGHIEVVTPALTDTLVPPPVWTFESAVRQPQRLKAADHKNGHQRMLALTQMQTQGGSVAFEGTSVDKAQILLTYLRNNRIVDF